MVALWCTPYLLASCYDNAQKYWKEVGKKSRSGKLHLSCIAKFLKYRCNLFPFYFFASISTLRGGRFLYNPKLDATFNQDTTTPSLIWGQFSFLGDSPLLLQTDKPTGTQAQNPRALC